ncbi:MAG: hypothetical protein ABIO24_01290, partial [Saprospiraceae bacterium]
MNRLLPARRQMLRSAIQVFSPTFCGFLFLLFFGFQPSGLQAQNTPFVNVSGPQSLCAGQCDTLFAVVSEPNNFPPPYTYLWTGPDGTTTIKSYLIICPQQTTTYTLIVKNANGQGTTVNYTVYVLPYQPLNILSSNPAPCNFDSSANACEKVCPNTTITYSVNTIGTPQPIPLTWQVTGASSYSVNNPPFNSSVTVNWGSTGTGSVSVFTNYAGGPVTSGCSGEAAMCVTIIEAPLAKFSTDPAATAGLITV